MQKPPGVARQQVTFLALPRKVTQRRRPRFAAAARFPALLDCSGGCGTRATRSDSPRRNPLTSLRYSAALRGKKAKRFCVRCAHEFFVVISRALPYIVGKAHPFLGFAFLSPERRLDQARTSGGVGRALFEHVAAQRIVRVAQPRSLVSDRGNPRRGRQTGAAFLGLLSLAGQRK